mmetsp:Transcript_35609/g.54761  ORF Transcript_35609/g.54761 Transcript_35609/m.54761 type:complete len:96 (+) Transcript_35609:348-635(+)
MIYLDSDISKSLGLVPSKAAISSSTEDLSLWPLMLEARDLASSIVLRDATVADDDFALLDDEVSIAGNFIFLCNALNASSYRSFGITPDTNMDAK